MYSYEDRIRAVELYIQLGKRGWIGCRPQVVRPGSPATTWHGACAPVMRT